jgi:hypothetical protein
MEWIRGEREEEEQRGVWFVAGVDNGTVGTVVCGRVSIVSMRSMRTLTSVFFVFATLWIQSAPRRDWLEAADAIVNG